MRGDHAHHNESVRFLAKTASAFSHAGAPARVCKVRPTHVSLDILGIGGMLQNAFASIEVGQGALPYLPVRVVECVAVGAGYDRTVGQQPWPTVAHVCPQPVQQSVILIGDVVSSTERGHRLA